MRSFVLHRRVDATGVSGTGVVADGVQYPDECVAMRWRGPWRSLVAYDQGLAAVESIHGHDGKTSVVWPDERAELQWTPQGPLLCCSADCDWEMELSQGCTVQDLRGLALRHFEDAHTS